MAAGTQRLLVTGFAAFPGAPVNPTQGLMRRLGPMRRSGIELTCACLPVSWESGPAMLRALIQEHRPAAVVMFGLAGRAHRIRIEVVARNTGERLRRDAAGRVWATPALDPAGPRRRRVAEAVAIRALAGLRQVGMPAERSHDAGTYLCNAALWTALECCPEIPVVFVHVPPSRRLGPQALARAATAVLLAVAPLAQRSSGRTFAAIG